MKTRIGASLLVTAMLSFLALNSTAQAQVGPNLTNASNTNATRGEWIWGHIDDPILQSGVTCITPDAETPSTIYVGGPGFIGVSDDSGATWTAPLRFNKFKSSENDADESEDETSDDGSGTLTDEMRIKVLREYLFKELEDELDSESAEGLLEEITDEELLDAESIEDIELLKDLELNMEPDLLHVIGEAEVSNALNLSDFDSFITRYSILKNNGAEEESSVEIAASSASVWDIIPTTGMTYAVTSDVIYMSDDKGKTWQTYLEAPENESILSFDVSPDSQTIAIGMTSGIVLTRDAGDAWVQLNNVIEGAVFSINVQNANNVWVLTTSASYYSTDNGLTWKESKPELGDKEYVVDVIPGASGTLMLTNQALYYSENGIAWTQIPCGPFPDEIIRQVVPLDATLSAFIVRTDSHVFQYTADGWLALNDMLFTDTLGNLALMSDEYSLAAMATPNGVWMAQNISQITHSGEYKNLYEAWEKEPNDYEIIQKALEAHYLDDSVERSWGLRSRLAWLLPTVTFDYSHRQKNTDRWKLVATLNPFEASSYSETITFIREKQTYWQIMAKWNIEIAKGFKAEEAGVRQEISLKSKRASLINNVKKLINKRRASQTTLMLDIPKLPITKKSTKTKFIKATLNIQEAEASLHYLTGGYYIPAVHRDNTQK